MSDIGKAYSQVYGWKVNDDGNIEPPYINNSLPDFVEKRLEWVSKEMSRGTGLTFRGAFLQLLNIDDEKKLKDEWELGAASDYLPVSKKYKEWLEQPFFEDIRRVAVMIAFIYR